MVMIMTRIVINRINSQLEIKDPRIGGFFISEYLMTKKVSQKAALDQAVEYRS
jgi:hypothetical protein